MSIAYSYPTRVNIQQGVIGFLARLTDADGKHKLILNFDGLDFSKFRNKWKIQLTRD